MSEKDSKIGCVAIKPENQNYEEAAASVYGGMLALQYLQKGDIRKGQKVLIYGASGSSGTTAVQIAKSIGTEVTGVCGTKNLDMVKSLGADKVIDYTKQDSLPEGEYYDLILDSVGKIKTSKLKARLKNALTKDGKYVSIDDGDLKLNSKRLIKLKEMIETGKIKPVIDKTYPMEDIVEAHRYVEKGHKKGNVIITIDHNGKTN
jgi:NADPH:quinone reductase-like Zn-dependent oxidoreductase